MKKRSMIGLIGLSILALAFWLLLGSAATGQNEGSDGFIPTEEVQPDQSVAFPVDI